MVDLIRDVVRPGRKMDPRILPNTRLIVTRLQRYDFVGSVFLGLRKASALGYLESQLRCWSPTCEPHGFFKVC